MLLMLTLNGAQKMLRGRKLRGLRALRAAAAALWPRLWARPDILGLGPATMPAIFLVQTFLPNIILATLHILDTEEALRRNWPVCEKNPIAGPKKLQALSERGIHVHVDDNVATFA